MSATTCRVCNERVIGNTHECPKELRERCEKYVKYHCHCPSPSSCDCLKVAVDNLESFAREIRNEALEEAAREANGRCGMHVDFWNSQKQSAANVIVKAIRALKSDSTETLAANSLKEKGNG